MGVIKITIYPAVRVFLVYLRGILRTAVRLWCYYFVRFGIMDRFRAGVGRFKYDRDCYEAFKRLPRHYVLDESDDALCGRATDMHTQRDGAWQLC